MAADRKKLLILGVYMSTEAYPNTRFRLDALKQSGRYDMAEINFPMSRSNFGNTGGFFQKILAVLRGLVSHLVVIGRYAFSKKVDIVYVPYPAVFVIFLLACLPGRLRPKQVVTDAFISIYDTIVTDRGLLAPRHILARLLYRIEKKAYEFSGKVIVDTPQNAAFLCKLFDLDSAKVLPIPLATDEHNFQRSDYLQETGICRVLFVGTLVPLHGIEIILEAANILSVRKDIVFKIVGDGQDGLKIEQWKFKYDIPLQWVREWRTSIQVATEIRQADICLGIFGSGDKTQRVCPFKIYAYAGVGRPIITGKTDWTEKLFEQTGEQFLETTPVGDAEKLAGMILKLADDSDQREKLALASRKLYDRYLSNSIANEKLLDCLLSS